jgi:hypothetical protein
MKIF